MLKKWKLRIGLLLTTFALFSPQIQGQALGETTPQRPVVTASVTTERARFTAPAEVYYLRLEVFDAGGQKHFDSDFRFGNLLDWDLLDEQGQRLADGAYRCLVTTRTLAGQLNQKHGLLVLRAGQPALQPSGQELQAIQTANPLATISHSEGADFLTIIGKTADLPLTLLAHDGERGRVVSGYGGLSFRAGDFFAGKDVEHMRLTAEGKLGLGVADPQTKLDVAGWIRASEGIVFPDGSVQTTAYVASGRSLIECATANAQSSKLDGSGTANRLAKWQGASTLADSIITDTGALVGIGTATPASLLTLRATSSASTALEINQGALRVAGAGVDTSTTVFIHVATWANIDAGGCAGSCTQIDHPLTNGDLNAILIVTPNITPVGRLGESADHPVSVMYKGGKWHIKNQDGFPMYDGNAFNVLVVKP